MQSQMFFRCERERWFTVWWNWYSSQTCDKSSGMRLVSVLNFFNSCWQLPWMQLRSAPTCKLVHKFPSWCFCFHAFLEKNWSNSYDLFKDVWWHGNVFLSSLRGEVEGSRRETWKLQISSGGSPLEFLGLLSNIGWRVWWVVYFHVCVISCLQPV